MSMHFQRKLIIDKTRNIPSCLTRPTAILVLHLDNDELAAEQPRVLHGVVQLGELLECVAGVFVPQPDIALGRDVELRPHGGLDVLQGVGLAKLLLPSVLQVVILCQLELDEVDLDLAVLHKHPVLDHFPSDRLLV